MHNFTRTMLATISLSLLATSQAFALDARTMALGGSAIANGVGVHGALENPSAMMRMNREAQGLHFHWDITVDIQDNARLLDYRGPDEDLPQDIEREIDALSGSTLTCEPQSPPETVCLTGTERLAQLSERVLEIMNRVDGESFNAHIKSDTGIAYTKWKVPVALHYRLAITGASVTDVEDGDRDYIQSFIDVLADDELTSDELIESVPLTISEDGQTLEILQPEDALRSNNQGGAAVRSQLGLSLATTIELAGHNVDIGITPKFSTVAAASLKGRVSDYFGDDKKSYSDEYKEGEGEENTVNMDFGATVESTTKPLRISIVARNLANEKVTTQRGFVFRTTPQFIIGSAYTIDRLTLTGDFALNKAKIDNFETQVLALGAEVSWPFLTLRAGISHDNARSREASAISTGFSLGPLHVGGRLTGSKAVQAAAQLSFSF